MNISRLERLVTTALRADAEEAMRDIDTPGSLETLTRAARLQRGVRPSAWIGVVAAAAVVVAALIWWRGANSDRNPEPAPPPPEVGDCHNTPDSNLDSGVWFDDSPVIDCAQPHTLQTLAVIETSETVTPELVEQLAHTCDSAAVREFVGSPGRGVYNVAWPIAYGPTPEQQEAGQSWVRCDAGFKGETHCCVPLVQQTGSLEGAMGKDLARFQECIDELPDPGRSQPLVLCHEPHRAELLMTFMERVVTHYPSAAKLEEMGTTMCRELVADRDDADSLVLLPVWQTEDEWQSGTLQGWCWIHRKTGLLPGT